MTYSELQTNVANYLHRADIAAKVPSFISLAESFLFRELQVKELQISVTGTTVGGYGTLPSDFGTLSRITVAYNGLTRALDYITRPEMATGVYLYPNSFSLENNKIRIWGATDGQAYTLYYIPDIQPLSDTVPTNWLLDNAADLYLYASALEGAKHVRNQLEIDKLTPQVTSLLDSVKRFADRRAQPVVGSMQMKPRR
jgi:hypothetical protein